MTRVLVTGATGFVGRTLCEFLSRSGYIVRAALRNDRPVPPSISEKAVVGDIATNPDWRAALRGVDVVLHTAARAHVLRDPGGNSDLYFATNVRGTMHLLDSAAQSGIRRFAYLSSIKVNGEESESHAYSASDEPQPADAYGKSKWLAEKHIMQVGMKTGIETVIVRSPLVYGPGVRANFLRMLRWVDKERPLPLGSIENSRSLVSIWNLCDLLVCLIEHPVASGRTWMVSDGEDLSTPEIVRRLANTMGRRARLLPVPVGLLRICGAMIGRKAEIARLCGSLAVNIDQTCRELGWSPPTKVDDALARTVSWYLSEGRLRET